MPLLQCGAKYTIWGKVVASLESMPWWVLWVQGCPWLVLAPKVFQPCANQLVCWFCAGLLDWVNCLTFFLIPSRSSNTPLYPSKVLKVGSVLRDPNLFAVSIPILRLSLPRGLGARHYPYKVLRAGERAPTSYSSAIFYLGITFEFFKELGARQKQSSPKFFRWLMNISISPINVLRSLVSCIWKL